MSNVVNFYTDGACSGNQNDTNVGGWGAILEYGDTVKELHAGELNTSNNKMELDAVINAFRQLKRDGLTIHVFTDSSYVANCFLNEWYVSWRRNGWKNKKKEPVENRERWEELLSMTEKNDVTFFRVKGHVNLDSPRTDADKMYRKFLDDNSKALNSKGAPEIGFDDFRKLIDMNNRADELANIAMDELR
jgi:ribonuclease HI